MKRIDRYILTMLVVRLLAVCILFLGLYVVFDVLKRIDHLRDAGLGRGLPMLLQYYACLMPTMMLETVPVLLLLAAGLTLVNMSRAGEILTLKASGVTVRRVALPVFALALPMVVLMAWAREGAVPGLTRRHRVLDLRLNNRVTSTALLRDREQNMTLAVQSYDYRSKDEPMVRVTVCEFYDPAPGEEGRGALRSISLADSGFWSGADIMLETVTVQEYEPSGVPRGRPKLQPTRRIKTSLTPYEFVKAGSDGMGVRLSAMTLKELKAQAARSPGVRQFRVMIHNRLAAPLVPFVLLLLGIPLLIGFESSVSSRLLGIFLCIAVASAFHVLSFVLISLGNVAAVPPFLSAWLPVGGGAAAGVWLFWKMRT